MNLELLNIFKFKQEKKQLLPSDEERDVAAGNEAAVEEDWRKTEEPNTRTSQRIFAGNFQCIDHEYTITSRAQEIHAMKNLLNEEAFGIPCYKETKGGLRPIHALVLLINFVCGISLLEMPFVMTLLGLAVGPVFCVLLATVCSITCHMLVTSSKKLRLKMHEPRMLFHEVVRSSLICGSRVLNRYGRQGSLIAKFLLGLSMFGVCTLYINYSSHALKQIFDESTSGSTYLQLSTLCVTAFLLPLICIRRLYTLTILMALALLLKATGILFIVYYFASRGQPVEKYLAPTSFRKALRSALILIVSAQPIGCILSVDIRLDKPWKYSSFPLNVVYLTAGIFLMASISFGELGAIVCKAPQTNILLDIPLSEWVGLCANSIYCLGLVISYLCPFYVLFEVTWSFVARQVPVKKLFRYEYMTRIALLIATAIIPLCGGVLVTAMNILMSSAFIIIGFVIAPLVDMLVYSDEVQILRTAIDTFHILLGIFMLFFCIPALLIDLVFTSQ